MSNYIPHNLRVHDLIVFEDAIRLLRENAEDETSYEVEIAGQLENILRYILKLNNMESVQRPRLI